MENKKSSISSYNTDDSSNQPQAGKKRILITTISCILVIAVSVVSAIVLTASAPKAHKRPPEKITPRVRIQEAYAQTQAVIINAMGTVVPAKEMILKSRVAGEILALHPEFTQGGIVRKGDLIVQIDSVDYELMVAQKQSAVTNATYNLKLELGHQDVARREWALLNGDNPASESDSELALRIPQLDKARSDLVAAKAELESVRLQLARTRIKAPFNAIIRDTRVEQGSQVAAMESLATLAGIDEYWVQVSVPVDRLSWIAIPNHHARSGAQVKVTYQGGATRSGRVLKLLSDLEDKGRMARLIIAVKDPLGLEEPSPSRPALLIGEYVRVAIEGRPIESAYRIPREALRDNTHIWIVNPESKLEIRPVETLWRDTRTVVLQQGLRPGDQVVISDLATPVNGMNLQVEKNESESVQPASTASELPGEG